jgi:type IV pilus assembly protein PilM
MASAQAVWGIDVGRCALTAIKLRAGADGNVEILAHDFIEHAQILSQPDADRPALIQSALEQFLSRNDISKDKVIVSVPGQHTLARFTKLPPVALKRIPDIVRYEADQQIPFDMDEVIWDYQTFQQEGLPDIEVGIFAMKRELIREHLLHFEQVAIEPIAVQSTPLAIYNAAHFDDVLGGETTVLLDVGAENTELVIATPYSLWTRTIPIGGNNCTEALVKSFKLSFLKAENLKRAAQTSKYRRQIFQAMRPVFADLVQELQRSIGFYSSTHRDAQIEKVFGIGNAFKLPGLQKYLQQNLGITVECPKSFKKATQTSAGGADALTDQFLSFWAAYGLALQGLELTKVNSNLLPVEIAKQVVWRKKKPTFAAAAACLLLAGGIIWFRQWTDMTTLAAGSDAEQVLVSDVDQASRIIDSGPSPNASLRAQAAYVQEAGNVMKRELSKHTGEGEDERVETEELISLQEAKSVVPRIFQLIHDAVPVLEGPLGEAKTQEEVLVAIAESGIPRGERKQVFIKSLDLQYLQDVNDPLWPDSLIDVPPPINNPSPDDPWPGFKITIVCTTPNQKGRTFVGDTFMKALREAGRQPEMGFYFDRVYLIEGTRIEIGDDAAGGAGSRGPSGRGRFDTSGPRGSTGADSSRLDAVTNEPLEKDWQFEIWIDAILDDYPEPESDEEEGE